MAVVNWVGKSFGEQSHLRWCDGRKCYRGLEKSAKRELSPRRRKGKWLGAQLGGEGRWLPLRLKVDFLSYTPS